MSKSLLVAFSSATSEDQIDAFNEWYTQTHVPEVSKALGSVTKVTRFQVVDPATGQKINRFCAIYEMDESDPSKSAASLAAGGPTYTMTDAINRETAELHWVADTDFTYE